MPIKSENELTVFDKQADEEELSVTKTYTFNPKDNEYIMTDSSENQTVYKRDVKNNTYAISQIVTPGDEGQNTTTLYTYDAQYNVTDLINPDGTTEKFTYDSKGNLLTSTTKEGTMTNTYNSQNQLVKSVSSNGEVTINTYDGPSLISTKVNDEETKFTYDVYGRTTKTTYANNTFEKVDYDDEARKITSTDKKGNQTSVTYSIYGQKVEELDADGHKKIYSYDPIYMETITSITDGNGHKTSYKYDDNNNLTTVIDALNRQKSYTYNDNDQVTSVIMPGMTFQYNYDLNGEMSKSILPSGIVTDYMYNSNGQLEKVKNGNETILYQYDEKGNITRVLRNENPLKIMGYSSETNLLDNYTIGLFTQSYKYDDRERETNRTTTYQNSISLLQKTIYKEDSDDIDRIQYVIGDTVIHDYQNEINVSDNQSILTLNNGLLKQEIQLNDANLLSSINYTSKSQQPYKITYNHTKNGNISKETVNGKIITFEYDQNDQLKKEILPDGTINTYEYDAVGNRTKSIINGKASTFTYNAANQITKKNNIAYKYDVDGNLTQDEKYKYTYNQQQRLAKVETLDGKSVSSYTYDENGLRLTKTVGETTHEYFYNNEVLEMEVVKVNNDITQYRSYEWSGYTPLGMIVKSKNDKGNFETKAYQFITNHRGDILSIRDMEDKEVGSYQYDAYGNVLNVEGKIAQDNPIRYAGYYYDEETKNYYLQARYYNPENGAFLALDPYPGDVDEPLSQNGYTYVKNNPVMHVDPNGEVALSIGRFKASINYALKVVLAQYIGWSNAEEMHSIIGGLVTRTFANMKASIAIFKKYKSFNKAINEFLGKNSIFSKEYKNKLAAIFKKSAKRLTGKYAARLLIKVNFAAGDLVVFSSALIYGYVWKYRKVK